MIRVLFVMSDLEGGGAERSLVELLRRLDRSRIEPRLFLLKRTGVHLESVPPDVPLTWGCGSGDQRIRYALPSVLRKAVAQAEQVDVVVGAMEVYPSYVAWLAAAVHGKPLVGWVRTDLHEYLESFAGWHRWLAQRMYPRCQAVVVPSGGSLLSIKRVAAIAGEKLHKISNPVDPRQVQEMASEPLSLAAGNLLAKPFLLGVGRLDSAQQGFDLLLRAHAAVRSRGCDHNLVIVGEGPDSDLLLKLAQSLNVQDSLFLLGFQRNPFPLFRAARALVAPARLDGFGRIFLEAMALGLPVIGSTASGPAEILDHGKYGISVPPEDVDALSDAIHLLLADQEAHARYSQLSLSRVQDYRPAPIALQWDDLLCGLAKSPEPVGISPRQ